MYKVKQSSENDTPFGELNFIYKALKELKVAGFIDHKLGFRNITAQYSYSDILLILLGNSICNGFCFSDLEHFKRNFRNRIPSPDTVEYSCQELKQGQQTVEVWLEKLDFPLLLTKQVFKNENDTVDELYLA
jgi:hypothetical protein